MGEGRGEVALIALAAEAFSGRAQINQSTNPAIWRNLALASARPPSQIPG